LNSGLALALAVVLLQAPVQAVAQQPQERKGDFPRIGVLMFSPTTKVFEEQFRQGLRDHGYVEGRNIQIEWRSAEGKADRADVLATELVKLKVRVIVAEFTPAVRAAQQVTRSIPIVMAPAGDPVATGFVTSLARPGGNITGVSNIAAELSGKRLEILREILPGLKRVGLLIHGSDPLDKAFVDETRKAAADAGIQVQVAGVAGPEALEAAFSAVVREKADAVIVLGNVPAPAKVVAQTAMRHRLPSIALLNQYPESGGLISYGANLSDLYRRAAGHVDKILKGARPADLPVEQPTKFDLVINMRTAKSLGLTIPPSLLLRADRVIE
jgi:putative ABC transport system substrate-binding protein